MFFARQSRIRKQGQTGNTLTGNACRDVCACHAVTSFLDNLAQVLHISLYQTPQFAWFWKMISQSDYMGKQGVTQEAFP